MSTNEVQNGTDDQDAQEFIQVLKTVGGTNEFSQQYKEHIV